MSGINWQDLKKAADDATKALPSDWYDVVVKKADQKTASTGSEMISVQFEVATGPHAGRALFTNFVLTPDSSFALSIFFRNLAALGIDDAFFRQLSDSGMDAKASLTAIAGVLSDRRARVEVGTRVWQGQDRNEVKNMSAATTGPGGVPGSPGPVGLPGGTVGGPPVPPPLAGTPPVPPPATTPAPPVPATASTTVEGPPLPF